MKKNTLAAAAAVLVILAGFHGEASADVLAQYTFTGSSRASSDTDPLSIASSITDGTGLVSIIDATRGNPAPSIAITNDQTDGSTNTAAVTANDYVTFTLTPVASLSLTNLMVDYANFTNDATFSAGSFFLRSSQNGFASNIGSTINVLAGSNGTIANTSFDLTGAAFQNVSMPIEFRVYFQDGVGDPDRGLLLDNIVLNGTAVPEPSTYALFGAGLLLCANRFRRRRSR